MSKAALVLFIILIALALVGCNTKEAYGPDQCKRHELFQECMKILPTGPVTTHENDWADVVKACESSSYYLSLRKESQIKPECSL